MIAEIKQIINVYLRLSNNSLDVDHLLEALPTDTFCPLSLVERLLEVGGCLFGNAVFDDELFNVFDAWLCDGKEIKVSMYARGLLKQLPDNADRNYREWLSDYANGKRIDRHGFSYESWPGKPETYLQYWNWPMFEYSQRIQDVKRMLSKYRYRSAIGESVKEAIAA